jgi:hypothetical protein
MKTKHIFIFAFLLIAGTFVHAQKVKWGAMYKGKRYVVPIMVASHNASGTTMMESRAIPGSIYSMKSMGMRSFDSNFNFKDLGTITPKFEDKPLSIEFVANMQGETRMFCSFDNKQLNKRFLFWQTLNGKELKPEGSLHKIAELDYTKRRFTGNFAYDFSRDSTKLLIYANTALKKNEPEVFEMTVYDQDLKLVWSKEITLPYSESKFGVEDIEVDKYGNVYALCVHYLEKGETKRKGKPNYSYKVLGFYDQGQRMEEYDVAFGDLFITDLSIDVSPKNDLICAGFYSEKNSFSIKGGIYLRINKETKNLEKASVKEFNMDFLTMGFSERQEKKAKKKEAKGKGFELYSYDMRDLIPRGDGGAVMLAEQYYVTVFCTRDQNGFTRCTYYYHYNDVVVVSFSPDGDVEWFTKVPKRQTSVNDYGYYSSFATFINGDKLHLIYNEHIDNLPREQLNKLKNYSIGDSKGIVAIATIDTEGNLERKALVSNAEIGTIAIPKVCQQISKNEMILVAKRVKKNQLGILSF